MARRPLTQADKDLYESVCRHWQADLEEKSAFANTNAQQKAIDALARKGNLGKYAK